MDIWYDTCIQLHTYTYCIGPPNENTLSQFVVQTVLPPGIVKLSLRALPTTSSAPTWAMPASTRRALYLGKTGSSVKHDGFGLEFVRPRTSDCCHGALLDGWMCLWLVCTWLLVQILGKRRPPCGVGIFTIQHTLNYGTLL